jgi:ubiquinone/menaquinone biosynthesis C-methylase UbiE
MESQLEKIKEIQKAAWNKSSEGWKKWDGLMMQFLQPINDAMISKLNLRESDHILDVATGTGEPGLTIAAKLKTGKVTGIDLSEKMLEVATEHAANRGVQNFQTVCCDASEMPFEDDTFDGITCRLGFMFFPEMEVTLREMIRVLKPGGVICASVWNGPDKNSWISNSMDVFIRRLNLKVPAPGSPGIYRCAEAGIMSRLFSGTGLKYVEETVVEGNLICDSIDRYWTFIADAASPLVFSNADENTRQEIKSEIISMLKENSTEGDICLSSSATVICGQKP